MLVKLPMWLTTLRNESGRSHAIVKAAIPPELLPPTARPAGSAVSYRRNVAWATRISTDGIYLHQLDDTIWAQGNTNLSHGCLNLSADNARWFYDFSQPGDVVEVRDTGGAPLELWQNGDWSVPWPQWLAGSAPDPTAQQAPAPVAGDPPPLSLGKQGADGQPPR